MGQKQKTEKKRREKILQGLRLAQAAVTDAGRKNDRKSVFFCEKIKIN